MVFQCLSFERNHVDGQGLKHIRKSLQQNYSTTADGLKRDMKLETLQASRLCGTVLEIDNNFNNLQASQTEQAPVVHFR